MKLLIDMNLSPRWVRLLREAGFDAEHWSAVGAADAADAEIMTFARAEGFVVLTHDLDFSAILAATRGDKPSVVQIRSDDISPEAMGGFVISALGRMSSQLAEGALLTIEPRRMRLRLLPLQSG